MTIERIEPIALRIPFHHRSNGVGERPTAIHLVLCRITTKAGVVGYGESLCYVPAMQNALVATIRDAIAPAYVGQRVRDRESLNISIRQRFAPFGRAGTVINALGAVDIALWDIAAKEAGKPLSALLGGARHLSVPVMASLDRHDNIGDVCARITSALNAKVAAIKIHEKDLDLIEAARAFAGRQTKFVVDLNNSHTAVDIVRDAARWEALELLWLEDPVWPPESLFGDFPVPRVPIGLGGELGSANQLLHYTKKLASAVAQPDVCMIGGVSEAKNALDLLTKNGVAIMPHTPFIGPAALASIHMISTLGGNGFFAMIEAEDHMDLYGAGFTCWRNAVEVPVAAGLGFDPATEYLERYALGS